MEKVNYRGKVINSIKYCRESVEFKVLRGGEFKKLNNQLVTRITYTYIENSKNYLKRSSEENDSKQVGTII